MSLAARINASIKTNCLDSGLEEELLTKDRTRAKNRNESQFWDYKEKVDLERELDVAKLSKRILAFHNAKGGAIFFGIDNKFNVKGVALSETLDSKRINDKIRSYVGPRVQVFQDVIALHGDRCIWSIFIPPKANLPVALQKDGPANERGRVELKRHMFFLRVGDESKVCLDPIDIYSLFTNVDASQQEAYAFDIDEPYFRLLAPHCERFFGRQAVLDQVRDALKLRNPLISLDGLGGVGKSAIAIELARQAYDAREYEFIASMSAKSRVWQGQVVSRIAGFSGFSEFISILASVLTVERSVDVEKTKANVLNAMDGVRGLLLIDNVEDIADDQVIRFLFREVPAPVKILITSRVERVMGALSVPIPEMGEFEARELFEFELARQGYVRKQSDTASVNAIVELTGRIPLAIKWSASIAARSGSLSAAEATFRGAHSIKQEFLAFCFTTMFEGLSKNAKRIALLNPYLDANWTLPVLSIALDTPEESVVSALAELESRGLVFKKAAELDGMPQFLPITKDFLFIKAKQSREVEEEADARLAAALGDANPLVMGLDKNKQIEVLIHAVKKGIAEEKLDDAERLALFLGQLLEGRENPWGRFLAGQIMYLRGNRASGKDLMNQAIAKAGVPQQQAVFEMMLGQLLVGAQSKAERYEGAADIVKAATKGEEISPAIAEKVVELLVRENDFALIRALISVNHKPLTCLQIIRTCDRLGISQNQQRLFELGPSLKVVVEEALRLRAPDIQDAERQKFQSLAAVLERMFRNP